MQFKTAKEFERGLMGMFSSEIRGPVMESMIVNLSQLFKDIVEATPMAAGRYAQAGRARSHWNISANVSNQRRQKNWKGNAWERKIKEAPGKIRLLLSDPVTTKIIFTNSLGYIVKLNENNGSFVEVSIASLEARFGRV